MSGVLTKEDLFSLMKTIQEHESHPPMLLFHPLVEKQMAYQMNSRLVFDLPGARRWRGPDGKTWIEKRWRTANVGHGAGNKVHRRLGHKPRVAYYGEISWG